MAFKMVLDSLDGLSEDVAKEYVEKDGKFVIQVEGMKTQADVDKVQTSLNAARASETTLKQRLGLLGDVKVEDAVAQLARIPELEAAAEGKLDETKIKELAETRAKALLAPVERERDTLKTQLGEKDKVIGEFTEKDKSRKIHRQVREAAKATGMREEAVEDAILLSDRTFELLEDGNAVVKEGTSYTQGLGAKDWLTDLQSKRPHWWPDSEGGGAGGNRGGGGSITKNPWSDEHWNMTEQGVSGAMCRLPDPGRCGGILHQLRSMIPWRAAPPAFLTS
jgi:hypothetical protein